MSSASRIIRNVMTPAFKGGDYDRGIGEGVAAIVGHARRRRPAPAGRRRRTVVDARSATSGWTWTCRRGRCASCSARSSSASSALFTVIGVMTPGVGWFLYVFLIPFWAMFPIVVVGVRGPTLALLALYVVGYPIAKLLLARTAWYQKAAQRSQDHRPAPTSAASRHERIGRRIGQLVVRRRRRRRLLRRRRQLGRRRQFGQLVGARAIRVAR